MDWRLGKITAVKDTQVSVMYALRGATAKLPPMHTVQRSARDVSIIYSAGDLMVNTREYFSALTELAKRGGECILYIFSILL